MSPDMIQSKKLVTILNELILIKENFKESY